MDWITGLQRALDYVEEHIKEPIDYEAVAKCAYSSSLRPKRKTKIIPAQYGLPSKRKNNTPFPTAGRWGFACF